jgi:hypothetical protein
MRIITLTENTKDIIDNTNGWGNVPYNSNVDYMGLRVKMKPTTFLKLAAPLSEYGSITDIQKHLETGGKIGAPFLTIDVPIEWSDDKFTKIAKVVNHEGRNRMKAILNIYGDIETETHLFFRGGINRNRHLTPDIIKELKTHLYSEKDNNIIRGPLFNTQLTESVNPQYAYPYKWLDSSPQQMIENITNEIKNSNRNFISMVDMLTAEFEINTSDDIVYYDHIAKVNAILKVEKNNDTYIKIIRDFGFSVDYSYKTTNIQKTRAAKIYATVAKILQEIIQEINPDEIRITANEKRKEDFYEKLINRIPNYYIKNTKQTDIGLKFIISKK